MGDRHERFQRVSIRAAPDGLGNASGLDRCSERAGLAVAAQPWRCRSNRGRTAGRDTGGACESARRRGAAHDCLGARGSDDFACARSPPVHPRRSGRERHDRAAIPLSGIRWHRRASALADLDRLRADASRTVLDVGVQAANAFLMLQERRRTAALVDEQIAFARDVVTAANGRYGSATAPQSDVLRAEVEVARLEALARALVSEVRGAETMLNTSLALDADGPVPPLAPLTLGQPIPSWKAIKSALASRPELAAGRAEVARAEADVQVMRDMFRPMAILRTGPSYTMAEGRGWMAMVGLSLPIWRGKLHASIAEAQAMRAMSEADLRAMTRMIEGDAAAAVNQVQAARARQGALTSDVLPRARLAIEPAFAGYASGQLPLVSVIEAVQALWLVQSDLISADTQLGLAWARLGRAIGSYEAIVQ